MNPTQLLFSVEAKERKYFVFIYFVFVICLIIKYYVIYDINMVIKIKI